MPAQSRRSPSRPSRAQRRAAQQGAPGRAPVAPRRVEERTARTYAVPDEVETSNARTYVVADAQQAQAASVRPAPTARRATATSTRRTYSSEPPAVDYSREWFFVRHDLIRILLIAGVLIVGMIALLFVLN